jgi:hypothetical protein
MRDKHSSNKILVTIIALVVAVLGTTGAVIATQGHDKAVSVTPHTQQQQKSTFTQLSYQGKSGQTALALLKKHAKVTTKQYSFGPMVESINGVASSGSKYWTLYVNGAQSQVGAGAYTTKDGDSITWKLE